MEEDELLLFTNQVPDLGALLLELRKVNKYSTTEERQEKLQNGSGKVIKETRYQKR